MTSYFVVFVCLIVGRGAILHNIDIVAPRPIDEQYTDRFICTLLLDDLLDETHRNRFALVANSETTHCWKILSLNKQPLGLVLLSKISIVIRLISTDSR